MGLPSTGSSSLFSPENRRGPARGHYPHSPPDRGCWLQIQVPDKDIRAAAQPVQQRGVILSQGADDGAAVKQPLQFFGIASTGGFQIAHLIDHHIAAVRDLAQDCGSVDRPAPPEWVPYGPVRVVPMGKISPVTRVPHLDAVRGGTAAPAGIALEAGERLLFQQQVAQGGFTDPFLSGDQQMPFPRRPEKYSS